MAVIRKTKPLKMILDAFDDSNNALSVVELVKRFQDDMNKTTVYRILERLEGDSTLHSFTGNDGLKWFAKCGESVSSNYKDNHAHFQCKVCGKSECLTVEVAIPSVPNYRVDSSNLILIGQCGDCIT